ncbi:MAG: hypothetical protein Q8P67_15965 [archaeon]|nr:hypothetical protein [archaeon]
MCTLGAEGKWAAGLAEGLAGGPSALSCVMIDQTAIGEAVGRGSERP